MPVGEVFIDSTTFLYSHDIHTPMTSTMRTNAQKR